MVSLNSSTDGNGLSKWVFVTLFLGSCFIFNVCNAQPSGNSEDGKRWFGLHRCDACHGQNGSGGKAPDIRKKELKFGRLLGKIRKSKSTIMPSYSDTQISDQNVADIYAYLQTEE